MTCQPSGETFSRGSIDRAGKKFVKNKLSAEAIEDIQQYRQFRMRCLTTSLKIIDKAQLSAKRLVGIRLKRLDSIHRKLSRPNTNFKLSSLDDIIGIRIILPSLQDVINVSCHITNLSEHDKVKNYLSGDHYVNTKYRAIHHIIKFQQPLSEHREITVRFEVQLRSYYQNLWANWSESHGENIKQGGGSEPTDSQENEIIEKLQSLSDCIARWEKENVAKAQDDGILPSHCDSRTIVAIWKQPGGGITKHISNNLEEALEQLYYWEEQFPHERNNALLLTGISKEKNILKVLQATHPNYILGRAYDPEEILKSKGIYP